MEAVFEERWSPNVDSATERKRDQKKTKKTIKE